MPYSHNPMTGHLDFRGCNYVVRDRDPRSTDTKTFAVPTIWVNSSTRRAYLLTDKTGGEAYWIEIGGAGVDFFESVLSIATCTNAPPTENLGDRYIISNTAGVVNPAWDGASKNSAVEFDGVVWIEEIPNTGTFVYVEDVGLAYIFDGTNWQTLTVVIGDMTETVKGVGELATDAETIAGTLTDYHVVNPSALKAKLGTQTNHGILVGAGTSTAITAITAGTAGQLLVSGGAGADPTWSTLTIVTTCAQGDIFYGSAANTISSLIKDATATRYLSNTGAGNNPAWDQIELTNGVSGILPVTNGGTGIADPTDHAVVVGSGAAAMTELAVGTNGQVLLGSTGADPVFGTISNGNNITWTLGAGTLEADLTGTTDHAIQLGNAGASLTSLAVGTNGVILTGATGADPTWTTATYPATAAVGDVIYGSALNTITGLAFVNTATRYLANTGTGATLPAWDQINLANGVTGTLPVANGGTGLTTLAQSATYYVDKSGNDGNTGTDILHPKLTIQAAVTAAAVGDGIIVYPGTYTETVTHAANNVTLRAQGKPGTCVITQADANVVDVNTQTGIFYDGFRIVCTAATTAINTVQLSTGSVTFRSCRLEMYSTAAIAAVAQPAIGAVTGAGTMIVAFGRHKYEHTGNGGGTAQKGAFKVGTGGEVHLTRIEEFDIVNSGTALASTVGVDTSSTGFFKMNGCNIEITDPDATVLAGLAYLGGTGTENEFRRNTIHIIATNNVGYGFYASDTASTSRFFYNHFHVEDTAGTSYSYHVGSTATVVSIFDDIIAADGIDLVAGGTFTCTSSLVDGDLTCRGREATGVVQASVMNMDNTAAAGNAAVNISVGGTTSTGDPYTQWLITGSTAFSAGIDNDDADAFKIGPNINPSTGNSDIEIAAATGAVTFNEAYEFPVADGTAAYPLVTDGAGNLDFAALTVAGGGLGVTSITDHALIVGSGTAAVTEIGPLTNGQLVIGSTGADPVAGTLTDGNNITFTEGAGTITGNLTGTTDHTVQVGNAGGSLTSLAAATNGQLIIGSTGADPAVANITSSGGTIVVTNGAGTINLETSGGLLYAEETGDTKTIVVNYEYGANRGGGVAFALPAAAAVGTRFAITGIAGLWSVTQGANQYISLGNQTSTVGVGGSLTATDAGDCITCTCIVADLGWRTTTGWGNITVT